MSILTQMQPWQQTFATDIVGRFEGMSAKMYLDTEGLVTVGQGCQITRAEAATLPFTRNGEPASPAQILSDYDSLNRQPAGRLASWYADKTSLVLPPFAIQALLDKRIQAETAALQCIFPAFDTWPDAAKIATCEMEFGLGDYKFRVQFPKYIAALRATPPDFKNAAAECAWNDPAGIYRLRNANRYALLMQAANASIVACG